MDDCYTNCLASMSPHLGGKTMSRWPSSRWPLSGWQVDSTGLLTVPPNFPSTSGSSLAAGIEYIHRQDYASAQQSSALQKGDASNETNFMQSPNEVDALTKTRAMLALKESVKESLVLCASSVAGAYAAKDLDPEKAIAGSAIKEAVAAVEASKTATSAGCEAESTDPMQDKGIMKEKLLYRSVDVTKRSGVAFIAGHKADLMPKALVAAKNVVAQTLCDAVGKASYGCHDLRNLEYTRKDENQNSTTTSQYKITGTSVVPLFGKQVRLDLVTEFETTECFESKESNNINIASGQGDGNADICGDVNAEIKKPTCKSKFKSLVISGTADVVYTNILGLQDFKIKPTKVTLGDWGIAVSGQAEYMPWGNNTTIDVKMSLRKQPVTQACFDLRVTTKVENVISSVGQWLGYTALPVPTDLADGPRTFQFNICKAPMFDKWTDWFKSAGKRVLDNLMTRQVGQQDNFNELGDFFRAVKAVPDDTGIMRGVSLHSNLMEHIPKELKAYIPQLVAHHWCSDGHCEAALVGTASRLLRTVRHVIRSTRGHYLSDKLKRWPSSKSYATAAAWNHFTGSDCDNQIEDKMNEIMKYFRSADKSYVSKEVLTWDWDWKNFPAVGQPWTMWGFDVRASKNPVPFPADLAAGLSRVLKCIKVAGMNTQLKDVLETAGVPFITHISKDEGALFKETTAQFQNTLKDTNLLQVDSEDLQCTEIPKGGPQGSSTKSKCEDGNILNDGYSYVYSKEKTLCGACSCCRKEYKNDNAIPKEAYTLQVSLMIKSILWEGKWGGVFAAPGFLDLWESFMMDPVAPGRLIALLRLLHKASVPLYKSLSDSVRAAGVVIMNAWRICCSITEITSTNAETLDLKADMAIFVLDYLELRQHETSQCPSFTLYHINHCQVSKLSPVGIPFLLTWLQS